MEIVDPYSTHFVEMMKHSHNFNILDLEFNELVANEEILSRFEPRRRSGEDSRFPALILMRRNFARIRDDVLAAIQILRKTPVYAQFGQLMSIVIIIGFAIALGASIQARPGLWTEAGLVFVISSMLGLSIHTVVHVLSYYRDVRIRDVVRALPFEIRYWISGGLVVVIMAGGTIGYEGYKLGVEWPTAAKMVIPVSAVTLAIYAWVEVGYRRKNALNFLRNAMSFLSYY